MKIKQVKALKQGDIVYHAIKRNADGTPMRAKVTRVEIGLKHGLYDYAKYNELDLNDIHTSEAIAKRVYFVRYNSGSNTVDIINKRKNTIRTFSPVEFVSGQSQYNNDTDRYTNYVHFDLWGQYNNA